MTKKVRQQGGSNRSDGITVQDALDLETVEVPAYLRLENNPDMGDEDLPVSYYTSREQHELERDKLWPKVWQLVCREDDILNPGDHFVHDIVDKSLIIVRTEAGTIKALVNSCLHRGRSLRDESGSVKEFRCPFHGFTWALDGSFKGMPCKWDFEHLCDAEMQLPEAAVDTWGGFVFVNIDGKAGPLLDYLGVIPDHFKHLGLEKRYTGVHVRKVINCNWKVGHEAFMESYHAVETHPQILPYTADANSQYDKFSKNVTRQYTLGTVPSPHLDDVNDDEIIDALVAQGLGQPDAAKELLKIMDETGMNARQAVGAMTRQMITDISGQDLSNATLSELQDYILYDVVPNCQIWIGFHSSLVYQFRPNGDDHESCIFDVRLLYVAEPDQVGKVPGVPAYDLAEGETFTDAEELGKLGELGLGPVFDQDMGNLPYMMKGLKSSSKGAVSLASYQESRLRHLFHEIKKYTHS